MQRLDERMRAALERELTLALARNPPVASTPEPLDARHRLPGVEVLGLIVFGGLCGLALPFDVTHSRWGMAALNAAVAAGCLYGTWRLFARAGRNAPPAIRLAADGIRTPRLGCIAWSDIVGIAAQSSGGRMPGWNLELLVQHATGTRRKSVVISQLYEEPDVIYERARIPSSRSGTVAANMAWMTRHGEALTRMARLSRSPALRVSPRAPWTA